MCFDLHKKQQKVINVIGKRNNVNILIFTDAQSANGIAVFFEIKMDGKEGSPS